MKLTIVTVNRNNADGLRRTLESTLHGQPGFEDWEQIVVDGASTDGSLAELERHRGDPHLGWSVSEPDTGVYNAMNKGAAHASGDFLLFLNSGDVLRPDVLKDVFAEPPGADILYGDLIVLGGDGVRREKKYPAGDQIVPAWFLFSSLPHPASFISRALFERIGGYDESLHIVSDAKFFLEASRDANVRFRHLPFPVSGFIAGGLSTDRAHAALHKEERRRMLLPAFGPAVVARLFDAGEFRPWIRDSVAQAAKKDYDLACCLLHWADLFRFLWRIPPLRWLLRGLFRAADGAASALAARKLRKEQSFWLDNTK